MDTPQRRQQLGLFVVVSAILLAAMAIFFGGTPNLFKSRNAYTLLFDDAPGVIKGTPVRKSGVRIGEVVSVELDDRHGKVRVHIAVDPRYTLREHEQPVIVPDLLSRDTTIDFMPKPDIVKPKPVPPPEPAGPTSKTIVPAQHLVQGEPGMGPPAEQPGLGKPIPPGSEIRGIVPPDVRQMLREASEVLPSAQMSLNQIRKSVERFERIAPILENTLHEYTELARAGREMVPEVRQTNDDLRAVLQKASKLETDLAKMIDEAKDAVQQYKRLGERVDVIVQTNQNDIDRVIRNMSDVTQRIAAVLNDENQRNFGGGIRNLQSMTKNLDELATQTRTRTLPQLEGVLLNLQQFTKPLADRSDRIAQNLDTTLAGIARTTGALGDAFSGRDGTLQRFVSDGALYNNLNDAAIMLTRILPRTDRILRDMEVFADKLARHPETIGLGGAIRPSAGLKDPPCSPPPR